MNGSFGLYSFLTGHMYSLCSVYYFIINKNQTRVLFFLLLFMLILKTLLNLLDSLIPVDFKKSRMYIQVRMRVVPVPVQKIPIPKFAKTRYPYRYRTIWYGTGI
ncbi:hypothetical protein HanXRQr2_Chr13g0579321 [Helianthus annuus]|uniref:Uncharacterized protein n=1 Tax=Helianthus annuus TaxID=4232 RepID=A0A9K3EG16_HELAN|nr:hypothetical protein HanXRQr2_Chr13g0579321 [Helianthus annuus]KAJ0476239.1 hypothetical protein HanHA300_Chr13g0475061 [Helianthus annuus]KAJ0480353.1 hypothetical protein HanIR_Chr13g0630641 [Helianthus annuus]KAJ0497046.1 hypothetical protein HanHA89_Chr13g0506981 [Helianthus annuus]